MSYTIPRPEHPNPRWKRESFINLNGEWMFEREHTVDVNNIFTDFEKDPSDPDSYDFAFPF